MNSGEQPLVDGDSPCLALLPDQQRPQTMMLRLSSRFALRTGWFECSAHFLRPGYANCNFERYALFFLAETAPPRPLGPKGEVYLPGAGKTYRLGFAS
jgi:hypothetical protein